MTQYAIRYRLNYDNATIGYLLPDGRGSVNSLAPVVTSTSPYFSSIGEALMALVRFTEVYGKNGAVRPGLTSYPATYELGTVTVTPGKDVVEEVCLGSPLQTHVGIVLKVTSDSYRQIITEYANEMFSWGRADLKDIQRFASVTEASEALVARNKFMGSMGDGLSASFSFIGLRIAPYVQQTTFTPISEV